ncbi:MAG: hypothetical protein BroJett040_22630 [Oligoflexia bacterium]|nr:MAG: hypothetical protein BroJett040_22630 [Oligoflexia bacterium]
MVLNQNKKFRWLLSEPGRKSWWLSARSDQGQILIETLITCLVVTSLMLALQWQVNKEKNLNQNYKFQMRKAK